MKKASERMDLTGSGVQLFRSTAGSCAGKRRFLKPTLLVLYVSSDKFFVRLCKVDNAFHQTDYRTETAGEKSDNDLDNPFIRVTQYELMDPKSPDENSADAGHDLLIRAQRLPIDHGSRSALINGLHGLVSAYRTQRSLAGGAVLGSFIVDCSTF
jgi:hypothetical protein